MLGFDLRERFKGGLSLGFTGIDSTEKNYRKSLDMDLGEYSMEILDQKWVFRTLCIGVYL